MKKENILTIIIIIIILALFLFAGIIAPYYFRGIEKPKWDSARAKMAPIASAIDTYKLNTGMLPGKLGDLVTCPAGLESLWKGPYLKKSQIYDAWDRPYIYEINQSDPNRYNLISYGEDGKPGGEGYNADIYIDRQE